MTDLTPERREELRGLCEAATAQPWTPRRSLKPVDGEYDFAISADGVPVLAEAFGRNSNGGVAPAEANAAFIAASRTALPETLDALDAAEAEIERLTDCLKRDPHVVMLMHEKGRDEALTRAVDDLGDKVEAATARADQAEAALAAMRERLESSQADLKRAKLSCDDIFRASEAEAAKLTKYLHASQMMERIATEHVRKALDALKPFADDARLWEPDENDGRVFDDDHPITSRGEITVGDLRRARALLSAQGGDGTKANAPTWDDVGRAKIEGAAEERKATTAFLRNRSAEFESGELIAGPNQAWADGGLALDMVAEAIERGDHMKASPPSMKGENQG